MVEEKNGFLLYKDLIHSVKKLPKEKAGELFMHILEYVNDENPETDDLLIELAFEQAKRSIENGYKNLKLGKYHWNWKNGKTPKNKSIRNSKEMKEWRIKIFKRDFYTCQHCRKAGGILNAHHIKTFAKFPELRFKVSNGITLCKSCHINEHKRLKNEK